MFKDKNGIELEVGDYIIPDEGMELLIVSVAYVPDVGEDCLFGQQVLDPLGFSLLTQENLSLQWTKVDPPDQESVMANLRTHTITMGDQTTQYVSEKHPEETENKDISDTRRIV